MVRDIILVLPEASLILWGGFCALQLAKREGGKVYALLDINGEPSPEVTKLLARLRSKAETEEIDLKIYLSDDKKLESALLDLLKRKDTVQILVAVKNRSQIKYTEKWIKEIEKKLIEQPDWPYSHLQYLVVPEPNDTESQKNIEAYYKNK
ncbi:phospholipase D-like domain-containing protein [Thermodesulfatator autotrophicus]|uniref:UspA domain-containing protein n=1 Tax=Thermodesulfatator autotrophicus TaxID=1795632 RepID=A0A177E6A3_9BACT|nr:hypothetical protein [Thermodesulfatator autotrophicus]OAG26752.1 hypothetical protein TH606_10685 [Thermodesulfatator autotrophicus]